jgi:GTPase SAR1 family protein
VAAHFFRAAHGVFVVYDIASNESLANVPKWIARAREDKPHLPVAVVGNKCDLPSRAVTTEDARAMVADKSVFFEETSATTGAGAWEAFERLVQRAFELKPVNDPKRKESQSKSIVIGKEAVAARPPTAGGCC